MGGGGQQSQHETEEAERSKREGNRKTWIFCNNYVCVKPIVENHLVCVYINLFFLHSFRAKFISLEGKAHLGKRGWKESSHSWSVDWEPGALQGLQHMEGSPSGGSEDGAHADLTGGPIFMAGLHFWEGCEHEQDLRSCVLDKAFPDSHELPSLAQSFRKWTLSRPLQWKHCLSAWGKVAGLLEAKLSLPLRWCHSSCSLSWGGSLGWAWRRGRLLLSEIWVALTGVRPYLELRLSVAAPGPKGSLPALLISLLPTRWPAFLLLFLTFHSPQVKPLSFASTQFMVTEIAFPETGEFSARIEDLPIEQQPVSIWEMVPFAVWNFPLLGWARGSS